MTLRGLHGVILSSVTKGTMVKDDTCEMVSFIIKSM